MRISLQLMCSDETEITVIEKLKEEGIWKYVHYDISHIESYRLANDS